MFHRSLEIEETLHNVARMAVESFADLCLFDLIDEYSQRLYVTAGAHRDPELEAELKQLGSSVLYGKEYQVHPALRVTESGTSFFVPKLDEKTYRTHAASPQHEMFMRKMGYRSKIVVPVQAQDRIFGALTFVRTAEGSPFERTDVQVAEELGRRAGLAVANAKQYHREQHVAATLQRAFLSKELPRPGNVQFHALYRPAIGDAELGGDWYDAFELRNGDVVFTIGDVTGKGIGAARMMVQIRQSIRVAATITDDPAGILTIVNDALLWEGSEMLATAFVAVVERETLRVRYASAGHPPPFVRWENGEVQALRGTSPPLGICDDLRFEGAELRVHEGAQLVLYTDGVTEATRDAIAGEQRLLDLIRDEAFYRAANPARYIERAIAGEPPRDDVAIMTLRFGASDRHWRFDVADSTAAYAIKRDLFASLAQVIDADQSDLQASELIFGELVGNALRYAPGSLSIALTVEDGRAELHLIDEGPGFEYDPHLPDDVMSESGRGLFLVSILADSVTVRRLPGRGSYIKVTLPVRVLTQAPPVREPVGSR
ncbi:MAG TPA: SpoIIE family protein phosphatase [Candidatus Limnocylindria bacterium]|jgi:anti-sigma regulatory factor (Ser/Thr protein kinase)|nr:SpoIIE family protein phosphatase [Candidatus Limnocylindria bacterium]